MKRRDFLTGSAIAVGGSFGLGSSFDFFSPTTMAWAQASGIKPPIEHNKAANKKVLESLPFNDKGRRLT
jgi:hypothetical protein